MIVTQTTTVDHIMVQLENILGIPKNQLSLYSTTVEDHSLSNDINIFDLLKKDLKVSFYLIIREKPYTFSNEELLELILPFIDHSNTKILDIKIVNPKKNYGVFEEAYELDTRLKQINPNDNRSDRTNVLVFHASDQESILNIVKDGGLDPSKCITKFCDDGKGCYMTSNLEATLDENYSIPNVNNEQFIVICQYLPGLMCLGEGNNEIDRSDNNEHGFCDTMVDNLETPTRYVLPYHKDIPDKHRMRCQAIAVLIVKTI